MDVKCPGTAQTQEEASRPIAKQLLHGREVSRMLQDHHRLQPRTDRRRVLRMLCCSLPAHRRKGLAFPPVGWQRTAEHPSVSLAFPPVGWQRTTEHPEHTTTVWAWLKTVVIL